MNGKQTQTQNQNQNGHQELTVLEPQVIARPDHAQEVDLQVQTAKAYPRSLTSFREEVLSLATIDVETARSCTYALPRGGKVIVGPSVRFMEIIASSWGNLREEKKSIPVESGDVVVRGVATVWDMEKNRAVRAEVTRRITDRNGQRYNDDMIANTANAAASIAHRNATKTCIPEGFWRTIWLKVQEVGAGNAATVEKNRASWMDYWKKQGIPTERVLAVLGVEGVHDIGTGEMATMQGLYTAIKAGDLTPDAAFPLPQATPDGVTPVGTFGFTKGATAKLAEQARAAAQAERKPEANADLASLVPDDDEPAPRQVVQAQPQRSPEKVADGWVGMVMALNGKDALSEIAACVDPSMLARLADADPRKGVKEAVGARFRALMATEVGAPGVDPGKPSPAKGPDDDEPWAKHLPSKS